MGDLILSCSCGLRMKAKGATPGRVGRCPQCGQALRVPTTPEVEPIDPTPPKPVDRGGYVLTRTFRAAPSGRRPAPTKGAKPRPAEPSKPSAPEVYREPGPWWRPDFLFPIRGAEGVILVVMLGLASWAVTVLVPELCLTFVADAARFDATLMGILVSIIAALPALMLGPLVVVYTLQYLGRVLVSGAMGEARPPRPPDRNFDGLFAGLGPWLIWLACGASVGLGPLAVYGLARGGEPAANPWVVAVLTILGLPYALMALLMTFLHDGGFPRPMVVVGTLIRFHAGFLGLVAVEAGLGLVTWGTFMAALALREGYFWVYLPLMLPAWMVAHWSAIVAMRILGVFYHHHAATLRWHREKPWWGVTWGI